MSLQRHLVLNRWLHALLGADDLEALKGALAAQEEGPGGDGQSHFFRVLAGRRDRKLDEDTLAAYDARLVDYEARLSRARGGLRFKYFQYLALLYAEILLDRLTSDPDALVADLNTFLAAGQARGRFTGIPPFELDDLRRLAFFLATGAGKTLLMHVNLWQVEHYLRHGRHPEALVRRADGRREFDGIYLITPNEGLSDQHLGELRLSGIHATHLVHDPTPALQGWLLGPHVRVVEIHKLAETATGEGLSIPLESLGSANLVFVDEGHKGTGAEARTWKRRQEQLGANGLILEYSATFAQAIGAAPPRARAELLAEYGKSIVFDYSYRHFHGDGYGKEFDVLNLRSVREDQAHELLLGGLLIFYQQLRLFHENRDALRPYQIEKPLWVFLGSRVTAMYRRDGRSRSDVATAVAFLRRFLEDRAWAVDAIRRTLAGESGFRDVKSGWDAFQERLPHLAGDPDELYERIRRDVFRGTGGLEVRELKGADGELGLKTSTPDDPEHPYFAVVNIGDVSGFKKHLAEELGIEVVAEERFKDSLFKEIDSPESPVSILIGAKKFIEGWSSWRVSTMGLLNLGRGEGPQVIQLFGRGVRLRGKDGSLRRSAAIADPEPDLPAGLKQLETLYIFGWNADYLEAFRTMLQREGLPEPVEVPVRSLFEDVVVLPVPRPRDGYSAEGETWTLEVDRSIPVRLDLAARAAAMAGEEVREIAVAGAVELDFADPAVAGLLDVDALYADVLEYKARRRLQNLFVPRDVVLDVLRGASVRVDRRDAEDPERVREIARLVLTHYIDRFVARREREAEGRNLVPGTLEVREHVPPAYVVRVASESLAAEIRALVENPARLFASGGAPLPRMHLDHHLWTPLLLAPRDEDADIQISPPGLEPSEVQFLRDLAEYWKRHHEADEFRDRELFVLRNRPGSGVGFFRRSGFFPDFIVWLRSSDGFTRVRFVEPHGMHHGGLAGNRDKIEAFLELERLNESQEFRDAGLDVGGYLVTSSKLEEISDAFDRGLGWDDLARKYRVLRQAGNYVDTILR